MQRPSESPRERAAILAAIVESSDDVILSKTLDGRITSWNAGAERTYGYTADEVIGRSVKMLTPAGAAPEIDNILDRIRRGERIDHHESVRVRKDGSQFYAAITISPLRDEMGRVVGASTIARDITPRKRLEQRREIEQAMWKVIAEARSLTEAVPPLLCAFIEIFDLDVGELWVATEEGTLHLERHASRDSFSAEASSFAGAARPLHGAGAGLPARAFASRAPDWVEELLSDPDFARGADAERLGLTSGFAFPVLDGNRCMGVIAMFSRRRLVRDAQLMSTLEGIGHALGQFVDRCEIEAALRASERRMRLITDSIPVLISYVDADHRYQFVNAAYERWFGLPQSNIQGQPVSDVLGAEAYELIQPHVERALAGETRDFEVDLPYQSGGHRRIHAVYAPDRRPDGSVAGYYGLVSDITERAWFENALRENERKLREADRRKDEFLAMLGHELRNPLAAITNGVTLLQRSGLLDDKGRGRWVCSMLERQTRTLQGLVDDLLDVSRITRGKIELQTRRVGVREVLRGAVETAHSEAEQRNQQLLISVEPGDLHLVADPLRLGQIVANLVGNAVKYTGEGGTIWLNASRAGDDMVLRVRDTGVGMTREQLEAAFEPFTQHGGEIGHRPGGLGLGLTLVKALVELHGGSVTAESEGPDRGTEFTVRLPLESALPANG